MSLEQENDFYWHALNYRTAYTNQADEMWFELEACMNRLIAAEREACAVAAENFSTKDGYEIAHNIRMRSNV